MKVFVDTNVIISYLDENRENHFKTKQLFSKLYLDEKVVIVFSEDIITNVVYNCKNRELAVRFFLDIMSDEKFQIVNFGYEVIKYASKLYIKNGVFSNKADFEDKLQYFCALKNGCSKIYTDDKSSFPKLDLPLYGSDDKVFYTPIK